MIRDILFSASPIGLCRESMYEALLVHSITVRSLNGGVDQNIIADRSFDFVRFFLYLT